MSDVELEQAAVELRRRIEVFTSKFATQGPNSSNSENKPSPATARVIDDQQAQFIFCG